MLPMLLSLRRAWEESEAVTDSVPVPSQKGAGKLWNHLQNGASRTRYLEASDTEPAGTCSSMNTVITCSRVSIFGQSLEAMPIETLATGYFLPLFRLLILWIMSPNLEIVPLPQALPWHQYK